MNPVEQSLPLTESERSIIGSKRNRALMMAPVSAAIATLLFLVFVGLIAAGVFSLVLIALLLFSLTLAVNAVVWMLKLFSLSRDLRQGQKRSINAPIEDQNVDVRSGSRYTSSSYNYWVKAGGRKLSVTEQQYYKLKKGDLIQAYVAPNSGTLLGISGGELNDQLQPTAQSPIFGQSYQPGANLASQGSGKKKWMLLAIAAVLIVAIAVVSVAAVTVMNMTEKTYNSLNPFAPKPPQGAFPDTIAGFRRDYVYYNDGRRYGAGYAFNHSYVKDGRTISYNLVDFDSPGKVADKIKSRYYFGADDKVIYQSDTEAVSYNKAGGGAILVAAGSRLIYLSGRATDLPAFYDALPYNALGISKPVGKLVRPSGETAIPAFSMLDEFLKDKKAATAKYDGKTLLFTAPITAVTKIANGQPVISLMKPGATAADDKSVIAVMFPASEAEQVAELKAGQTAQFRCRVSVSEQHVAPVLDDCKLEKN